nr:immunoglobulin light chain junction region [Macaca mulatta]MOV66197.1 immunoglobulin light chain junction region [Macaca mulatta]MOV66326.1 immunoglobulin light chain junction region [Macaca mulatta]MOV66790.1 immunoglobulin light chain junction region [Macaca mulatta]MOV67159.1 immunoglobulin light chain junction region [Macaca mulatta]
DYHCAIGHSSGPYIF